MYTEKMRLRTMDMDGTDKITYDAILSIFQDVAGIHATKLGFGFEEALSHNCVWVLVNTKIEIIKEPKAMENVIIKTWPHKPGRVDIVRDYLMENLDGEILVKGTSRWCLIDVVKRNVVRFDVANIAYDESILPNYNDKFRKLEEPSELDFVSSNKVEYSFVDHNNHMNNVFYARWITNYLEKNHDYKKFDINYIKEAKKGDVIDLYVNKSNELTFVGKNKDSICFIAVISK